MMPRYLSKSNFMHWLIHPAYLWLEKHDKKRLPPITEADQFMFSKGHDFEEVARGLFPRGRLVDAKPWEFDELQKQTRDYMEKGEDAIFQATTLTERGLLVKSDVLKRRGKEWDLYEIKSSTRVKDDHLTDLAFQAIAWGESGISIAEIYICHVNRDYVRGDEIEANELVHTELVTESVQARMAKVEGQIPEALSTMESAECPSLEPDRAGNLGLWMPLYFHLRPELPEDHPYRLAQLKPDNLERIQSASPQSLREITELEGFNSRQCSQILAWQREPVVNRKEIDRFLDHLEFPLWFLDYETISHAVPLYPGSKPYQDVPFQYSLHRLASVDAELEHFEYLATAPDFPVPELLSHLRADLDGPGSVLVWYQNFEKSMNSRMGEFMSEHKQWLEELNERIVDLMIPFANGWYVDKYFAGSASIKNVLPVLAPKLSYKTLGVQDGGSAQAVWYREVYGTKKTPKVFDDLRAYCALDTLAMVEIYRFLVRLNEDGDTPGGLEQAQLF